MAATNEENVVWNKYIDKYGKEPTDASKLLNFSKNKNSQCINLNFATAKKVFDRNKGKGRININSPTSSTSISWEEKFNELQSNYKSLAKENDELRSYDRIDESLEDSIFSL